MFVAWNSPVGREELGNFNGLSLHEWVHIEEKFSEFRVLNYEHKLQF